MGPNANGTAAIPPFWGLPSAITASNYAEIPVATAVSCEVFGCGQQSALAAQIYGAADFLSQFHMDTELPDWGLSETGRACVFVVATSQRHSKPPHIRFLQATCCPCLSPRAVQTAPSHDKRREMSCAHLVVQALSSLGLRRGLWCRPSGPVQPTSP